MDADVRGLGLRPAYVVLTRGPSQEANNPWTPAMPTAQRARPRVSAVAEPHKVRFAWHVELDTVHTAVIRVAPSWEAIKRAVNVVLSRYSRDFLVRLVAKRLFWHDSGDEIRRSWKWNKSDAELPLIIATADELWIPRQRAEAWVREYLAKPTPLQRCVDSIAQQIDAVPGAVEGPAVAGVILLRGGGGAFEVLLMRDTAGRRHFPRSRRRVNGTNGYGECCLTAALRATIDATGMDPVKHLDLLRGWFTVHKNKNAAWHSPDKNSTPHEVARQEDGGVIDGTDTTQRYGSVIRYYVGWVNSNFKPTDVLGRRHSISPEQRPGSAPPRSVGADLRVQPTSPRCPTLTINKMLRRTPVGACRAGEGSDPDPLPLSASWESVDHALRYPIWPTSEKRMIARLMGGRMYMEPWGRCGSIFQAASPAALPPAPAPATPAPAPTPPPPPPDSLTTRWVWPAPTRQLLIPQVVEEPLAFATQATPMVSWLAAHPTEIWPRLRTMWEAHAKALDAECCDNSEPDDRIATSTEIAQDVPMSSSAGV